MYAQDNNPLPVWIILSPAYHHISINSQPFLVGIVSVWIGDTGAMRHMTRHNIDLKNQRKPNGSRATMGNGHVEKASVVGDIFGTVCDKHGDQL